jgi:bifunctional non-homologous end joining protein LigD
MAEKLSTYRAKRNFEVTAEPSGADATAPSERLRFVIQKHDATRLHYDFRLEYEGVFKSWAVTRGPSLDPHDKRLAVEVEDHPLDYGDFEGTIPKGQYGGGTVMLWDRGYWAPDGMTVEQGLAKGDLKIVLEGERLHGGWVLVRIKNDRSGGKRTNWLLIKHKDPGAHEGDADAVLEDNATSVASGRTLAEIAAGTGSAPTPFITKAVAKAKRVTAKAVWNINKGDPEASALAATPFPLDGGSAGDGGDATAVTGKAATKAKTPKRSAATPNPGPSPIQGEGSAIPPPFIEPQLTRSVDRPPAGADWAHEIKFDGYRMQLRVAAGVATLKTRKGLDWTERFKEIAAEGASLPDCIIDGEIVALDDNGAPDFAGLQLALSEGKTAGLVFFTFDLMHAGGHDLRPLPLSDRKARLEALLAPAKLARFRYVEHFESGGDAVLQSACSLHLEGIVSKRMDAPYTSGRSDSWTKAKCRGGQEVVVAGWTSEGANAFRSLIAGVYREGQLVHVGRIGTGYSRDKVAVLLPKLQAVETDKSPFDHKDAPKGGPGIHWVKPVLVAEIESAGWTGSGALRQASFKGLREDKPADEVVAETPTPVEDVAAKSSKPTAKTKASAVVTSQNARAGAKGNVIMGVTLSHPEKVLWPAADGEPEVSKLDLARYWEALGPAVMPHIIGRPCSIIRSPDGIDGQTFFQRHAGQGTSSLLEQVTVFGDKKSYLQIDRVEGLIAIAQTAGLEIHPWNCMPGDPETPGRLVFDLDPAPDLAFADVVKAAHEVKARLEALGLVAFCKTTGGKGLHVVTPLAASKGGVTWPQAKTFAHQVCIAMAADSPDKYLTVMTKAKRTGRIFLDYLRNDRMATAVAPFSPRGRPGAPVSWPVSWAQVKPALDPKAYTIRTAPGLLKRLKAWDDYDAGARPLAPAIKALASKSLGGKKAA